MSDESDWERRWINACRTIGGLEQENERLRAALVHIAEHLGSMTVAAKSSHVCQARDIARAALEAKP